MEYVIITWLTSRTTQTILCCLLALTEIIKFYYGYDWCVVKEICGDRDAISLPLKASLLEHNKMELDIRGTGRKIPRAERMIRTLRDIFRTFKAALWYKLPPAISLS